MSRLFNRVRERIFKKDVSDRDGLVERAYRHFSAGEEVEAIAVCEKILSTYPGNPEALVLKANIAGKNGDVGLAADLAEQVLRRDETHPGANELIGNVHRVRGDFAAAACFFRRALEKANDDVNLRIQLALSLHESGDSAAAREVLEQGLAVSPEEPAYWYLLGVCAHTAGEFRTAIDAYANAVSREPDHLDAHINMARAYQALQENKEAEKCYRAALSTSPERIDLWEEAGKFYVLQHRHDDALSCFGEAAQRAPLSAEASGVMAGIYEERDDLPNARRYCERAVQEAPDNPLWKTRLSSIALSEGKIDEAIKYAEQALTLDESKVEAFYQLAGAVKFNGSEALVGKMEALLNGGTLSSKKATLVGFSLGKIYDDAGSYEKAFHYYEMANNAVGHDYRREEHEDFVQRSTNFFTRSYFGSGKIGVSASERPVLIVGMPRSGTTLVEQILGTHEDVAAGGELPAIGELVKRYATSYSRVYPEYLSAISANELQGLTQEYLAWLDQISADTRFVTDKMPGNYFYLGFIGRLFPNARIIYCRRNPLDTCLSCYFQNFTSGQPFAYDLTDLAHAYRLYERLMTHWLGVLPNPVLEVDYEELVRKQEEMTRRMLAFLDLPWQEECLDFHRNERSVLTASRWQVRQKMYDTSIGRWRNYERQLRPLIDALGETGSEKGSDSFF